MVYDLANFPIEFHNEVSDDDLDLYLEAETFLQGLAKGNHDITGATIILTQPAQGRETPYVYEATVTLWIRPENVAARRHGEQLMGTMKDALRAVERQTRDKRDKLRERERQAQ